MRFPLLTLLSTLMIPGCHKFVEGRKPPNVLVIVADDLGIGDLGCYGNDTINTPNIDKLASEGVKLTHHLATAPMCTPSRAALMTARYAARYGLEGEYLTPPVIVHLASKVGLPVEETTLAKVLASANYTTTIVGKWHLGARCGLFGTGCNGPQVHGFQDFYGIPFTLIEEIKGDYAFWMFPLDKPFYQGLLGTWIASLVTLISMGFKLRYRLVTMILVGMFMTSLCTVAWFVYTHYSFHLPKWWRVTPWMQQRMNSALMHNEKLLELPVDLESLTEKLVSYSVKFLEDHAHDERPFFLYHSFGHVHVPMYTAPHMAGRSKHGRYGDNVEEMDAGVGAIMDAVARLGLDHNTIVYFLSDHGGHLEAVDEDGQRTGGHNGLYKGGKSHGAMEGGIQVPGIYRWKGHLPSSVSFDTPTSLLDMLPTILDLVDLPSHLPQKELDGVSIAKLLQQGTPPAPRVLLHHCGTAIHALRWVLDDHVYKMFLWRHKFFEGSLQCGWGPNEQCSCFADGVTDISHEPLLFDLARDPYEDDPISPNTSEYQEVVGYLKQYLSDWKERVPYPPSQYRTKINTILSPWLQPFCTWC